MTRMLQLELPGNPDTLGEICLTVEEQLALQANLHDMIMSWGISWLMVGLVFGTIITYIWMRRCYGDPIIPL